VQLGVNKLSVITYAAQLLKVLGVDGLMVNRLSQENSPYLLQHADNPVDWHPWGEEALQRARQEDKPIFLSIGYAACHWCHVMAHESFEDYEIAGFMNDFFINIKVDREERPDLDSIYMSAVVAMTGHGGWPMSIFLTPDGQPFYGGTYFPPVQRYNMPSFQEVLASVHRAWEQDRQQILQSGQKVTEYIRQSSATGNSGAKMNPQTLEKASFALGQSYDWKNGGWGSAPKFPQPMVVEYLLRRAVSGDTYARDIAAHTLQAMARGGMYDVVGGGFARYSTDNYWLVPHFEKMLYDNAQLALVYLHGYLISGAKYFRRVSEETLDFIIRELAHPQGGFYSSLDADSEGEEGKYYVWTLEEIRLLLNDPDEVAFLAAAYNITASGNFESANVLQRALDDELLAERFGMQPDQVPVRLSKLHKRLRKMRDKRVRPATDDKVLVSWNALALAAFAEAARYFQRRDYLEVARRNAAFLLDQLYTDNRLFRSWRNGQARYNAFLEDYAGLITGLLALYQTDQDNHWYEAAEKLTAEMVAHYRDRDHDRDIGFYDTRDDHDRLITRPKDLQDNAIPSGNALAAAALLRLSVYQGNGEYRQMAEEMLAEIQSGAERYPTAFGQWLCEIDFALSDIQGVAILGDLANSQTHLLAQSVWRTFRPNILLAAASLPLPEGAPPLLHNRDLVDGLPTAYVCKNFVCLNPVTTADKLLAQLENLG
jgi:hypothetical protein